ncbi:MAG: TonB-dependent receptor [Acidobacteria bacterium]|nr:TonB-dependent receptor [Acidobacteriota bacterium]
MRTGGRSETASSYSIGDTWLISPITVASVRLAASYTGIHRVGAEMFNMSEMGVKGLHTGYQPKYSTTNVTNGFNLGGGTQNESNIKTFSTALNADVSLTRGTHQIAVGGALNYWDSNSLGNVFSMGVFTFTGQHTGLGLADFMLGRLSTFRQASPNFNRARKYSPALYFADSWKAARRLTVNYGIRWEPDVPEILKVGSVQSYSEERRLAGTRSTVYKNAPPGFYYPGDPGHPGKRGRNINWWTVAPRLGLAWDVTGDGRTSVRASGGFGYDSLNIQAHLWTSISPPFNYDITVQNPMYDDPWATIPGGSPFPAVFDTNARFVRHGGITVMPHDLDPSKSQSWNLAVQRQLGEDFLVSASYLGNHIVHMLVTEALNPAIYVPGVADASGNCFVQGYTFRTTPRSACSTTGTTNNRRLLSVKDFEQTGQFVGALAEYQSAGKSSYHGMLLDVRKRASRGVTLSANYTWSHCLASDQDTLNGSLYDSLNTYIFVGDRDRGITNCSSDRRHVFNLTSVAQMPRFANNTLRALASGWQLAPIYRTGTGSWMSVTAGPGVDPARNGTAANSQPAQQVLPNPYGDTSGRPGAVWFNKDAFAQPAVGTFGNMKPRTVRGPRNWSFDVALSRAFRFKETQRLDFRVEAYNVTNSFRPNNPNSAQNSALFGIIRTAQSPRILQFALKYAF